MISNLQNIKLKEGQIAIVKGKKVLICKDLIVDYSQQGYFILNFWEQCDYPDLEVFPVEYVECRNDGEVYELFQDNIIIGKAVDLCLI